jgi:hypothetical protein
MPVILKPAKKTKLRVDNIAIKELEEDKASEFSEIASIVPQRSSN